LSAKGANIQRLLWASTSTKNPKYSDILYVQELIGKQTVNTMPPATIDNFIDHGKVEETLTKNVDVAEEQIKKLSELGINLEEITAKLQVDGVKAFSDSFKSLLLSIEEKMLKFKEL
jgi:transaldolase/transaldolase/glucose-6-phosphate isomerase